MLEELYVHPELRGRGIGTAIMDLVETAVSKADVIEIQINVDEVDVDARRFTRDADSHITKTGTVTACFATSRSSRGSRMSPRGCLRVKGKLARKAMNSRNAVGLTVSGLETSFRMSHHIDSLRLSTPKWRLLKISPCEAQLCCF